MQQFMEDMYKNQKESEQANLNLTAQEARDRANAKHISDTNSQLSEIMSEINKAVTAGKLEVWVYDNNIKDPVRERLSALGYSVGPTQCDRNEYLTKIEW